MSLNFGVRVEEVTSWPSRLGWRPQQPFEQGARAHRQLVLPMDGAAAQQLTAGLDARRNVYAVVRVGLSVPRSDAHPNLGTSRFDFHFAANEVELFADESLTRPIGTVPLFASAAATDSDASRGNHDVYHPNAPHLDGRLHALLRFAAGPLQPHDLETLARGIGATERNIWTQHERHASRLQLREQQVAAGAQPSASEMQRLRDRAQLSATSWHPPGTMSPAQQQAFFDYVAATGAGDPPHRDWPRLFPGVNWGMNVLTVFPRGTFSTRTEDVNAPVTAAQQQTVARFAEAISASQQLDRAVLAYPIDPPRYDGKSGVLRFATESLALAPIEQAQFTDDTDTTQRGAVANVFVRQAAQRVLYRFVQSNQPLGEQPANVNLPECREHAQRKSTDCALTARNLSLLWPSTALALDRQLQFESPAMSAAAAERLSRMSQPGWRVVLELSALQLQALPYRYTSSSVRKPRLTESHSIFATLERLLIVDPDGRIVWQKQGARLPAATEVTRTLAEDSGGAIEFPSPLPLNVDGVPNTALFDLLLARHHPAALDARMLEAMLSSRWGYEQQVAAPIGGRFFNATARAPAGAELQDIRPRFRAWLARAAAALPDRATMNLPLHYAQGTVNVFSYCLRATEKNLAADAQVAHRQQEQAARRCQSAHDAEVGRFQQCQQIRTDLQRHERTLEQAEAQGCTQAQPEDATAAAPAGSQCTFTSLATAQQDARRCMEQRCGPTPTTAAGIPAFQQCVQQIQPYIQQQMQALIGGNVAGAPSAPRARDACAEHRQQVTNLRSNLRMNRCDNYSVAPGPADCPTVAPLITPTDKLLTQISFGKGEQCHVASAFDRRSRASALLLAGNNPYSDTALELTLDFAALPLPLSPPVAVDGKVPNAQARISFDLAPAGPPLRGRMSFVADNVAVEFEPL